MKQLAMKQMPSMRQQLKLTKRVWRRQRMVKLMKITKTEKKRMWKWKRKPKPIEKTCSFVTIDS